MYRRERKQDKLADNAMLDAIVKKCGLEKVGDYYNGLCPLHVDKDPQFSINARKMTYRCSGCHRSGKIDSLYKLLFLDSE